MEDSDAPPSIAISLENKPDKAETVHPMLTGDTTNLGPGIFVGEGMSSEEGFAWNSFIKGFVGALLFSGVWIGLAMGVESIRPDWGGDIEETYMLNDVYEGGIVSFNTTVKPDLCDFSIHIYNNTSWDQLNRISTNCYDGDESDENKLRDYSEKSEVLGIGDGVNKNFSTTINHTLSHLDLCSFSIEFDTNSGNWERYRQFEGRVDDETGSCENREKSSYELVHRDWSKNPPEITKIGTVAANGETATVEITYGNDAPPDNLELRIKWVLNEDHNVVGSVIEKEVSFSFENSGSSDIRIDVRYQEYDSEKDMRHDTADLFQVGLALCNPCFVFPGVMIVLALKKNGAAVLGTLSGGLMSIGGLCAALIIGIGL